MCDECTAGKYSKSAWAECSVCPANTKSDDGAASCVSCEPGRYSAEQASSCDPCSNKVGESEYSGAGCVYQCLPGYVYPSCDTPFNVAITALNGVFGFGMLVAGISVALLLPCLLIYCRTRAYKRAQERQDLEHIRILASKQISSSPVDDPSSLSTDPTHAPSSSPLVNPSTTLATGYRKNYNTLGGSALAAPLGPSESPLSNPALITGQPSTTATTMTTGLPSTNPVPHGYGVLAPAVVPTDHSHTQDKKLTANDIADRLALRPRDLPRHMGRLYFMGHNSLTHPFFLDLTPEPSIAPLVVPNAFAAFARDINDLARYDHLSLSLS